VPSFYFTAPALPYHEHSPDLPVMVAAVAVVVAVVVAVQASSYRWSSRSTIRFECIGLSHFLALLF